MNFCIGRTIKEGKMKNLYRVALSIVLFLGFTAVSSYAGTEKYGEAISNRQLTAIKDILANPKAYEGKLVTIEGRIANECSTGCWFFVGVAKGDLVIYVDIGQSGFAIPQKKGRKILVEGTVVIKASGPMIQGKGVEVQ
jgi:hypothetical protein